MKIEDKIEMEVGFYESNNQQTNDSVMTDEVDYVEANISEEMNLDTFVDKINACWETQVNVSLRALIEKQRKYLWSQYSDSYPDEAKCTDYYSYDKVKKIRTEILKPKTWGEFVEFVRPLLPKKDHIYLDLLDGGENSEFCRLSEKIHSKDNMNNVSMLKILFE